MKRSILSGLLIALCIITTVSAQSPLIPALHSSQEETVEFLKNAGFLKYNVEHDGMISVTRGSNHLEYRFSKDLGLYQVVLYKDYNTKKEAHDRYDFLVQEYLVNYYRNVAAPEIDKIHFDHTVGTAFKVGEERTEILLLKKEDHHHQLKLIFSDAEEVAQTSLIDLKPVKSEVMIAHN